MSSRPILLGSALATIAFAATPACGSTTHLAKPAASTSPATSPGTSTSAPTPTPTPTPTATVPCGAAGATVLADAAGSVAAGIYASEESSAETARDRNQIESYGPLLSAVERGEHAAIEEAVHSLVYSGTHIVRLRVSQGSKVLSDIGGPYIIAPVTGVLRSHGRAIAHFVFSVQDDLGYVKLETRFLGAPLVLRTASGQVPIEGQLQPGPARIPDRGPVTYHGAHYEAFSFNAKAFPSGRLRVSILLTLPHGLQTQSCVQIKADVLGRVAQRISRRFSLTPSVFASFVRLAHAVTGELVYVRAGSRTLAGSTRSTPRKLPTSGALRWHGVNYEVSSFSAPTSVGAVHVYVLVR
jgi:hypothetical protein